MRDIVFCMETQYRDVTSLKLTYKCNAIPINVQWMFWNLVKDVLVSVRSFPVVQWLRFCLQCRGCKFDPLLGN